MSNAYDESDRIASEIDKSLVTANTRFSLNLIKELQKEDQNIFISPLGISTVLSMIYNGAEGSTKDAIAEAIQIKDISTEAINEGLKSLISSLENADSQVSISIGNSIWIRKSYELSIKPRFKEILERYYQSEILPRQFNEPETVKEINDWVKKSTEDKINKMIDRIDPSTLLFLINAIYFKGGWTNKFSESKTSVDYFYLRDNTKTMVNMMSLEEEFYYFSDDNSQIVRLPYGRSRIAMYILLPNKGVKLDSFINDINQEKLEQSIAKMGIKDLELKMPKLKLEYGIKQLNSVLTNLGMGVAFKAKKANFNSIVGTSSEPLFISSVDHKAVIEINEKGTEAAAVSVIGIAKSSMFSQVKKFVVNRPYLFLIRDDRNSSILFIGKVLDPK